MTIGLFGISHQQKMQPPTLLMQKFDGFQQQIHALVFSHDAEIDHQWDVGGQTKLLPE